MRNKINNCVSTLFIFYIHYKLKLEHSKNLTARMKYIVVGKNMTKS